MPPPHTSTFSLERGLFQPLDTFMSEVHNTSPEHAEVSQTVINAVKSFSTSVMKRGTSPPPPPSASSSSAPAAGAKNNLSSSSMPSSHTSGAVMANTSVSSDREMALASLLTAVTSHSYPQRNASGTRDERRVDDVDDLTAQLKLFREDVDVIEAYKSRIVELQKIINGTKLPGELSAVIDPAIRNGRGQIVPVNADGSAAQRQNESIHQLTKHIVTLKEKLDRAEAENCQWSANVAALLGENSMLTDRVRLLESEVTSLGKNNASLSKELAKARVSNDKEAIVIGGVSIDPEVALWIKDVYVGLSQGKETSEVLSSFNDGSSTSLRSLPVQRAISSRARPNSDGSADTPFSIDMKTNGRNAT